MDIEKSEHDLKSLPEEKSMDKKEEFQNSFSRENENETIKQNQDGNFQEALKQKVKIHELFKPHSFIPPQYLGDTLEIYTFFQYFYDLLEGPEFEIEELWACFQYQGEEFLDLIHDIHMVIILLFIKSLEKTSQKFEGFAQKNNYSLFLMIQQSNFKKKIRNIILLGCWPLLLKEIIQVFNSRIENQEEIYSLLQNLTIENYNQLNIGDKIKILLSLTKSAEDLSNFKKFHSQKSEEAQELVKIKSECTRKLQALKQDYNEAQIRLKETEEKLMELEKNQEENLEKMDKEEIHSLVKDIKNIKIEKNKFLRQVQLFEGKKQKLNKKLFEVRQELPFAVHLARTLGIDDKNRFYWIFIFKPEIIFMSDQNQNWFIYDGPINKIIENLNNDQVSKDLKKNLDNFLELKIINEESKFNQQGLETFVEEIFQYKSYYKDVKNRIKTRRETNTELDKKFEELNFFIQKYSYLERIQPKFLKDYILFLEQELQEYMDLREGFWIDPKIKTKEFFQVVKNLESVIDFGKLILDCEKQFSQLFIYQAIDDSNEQKSENESDKQQNNKIEDDEGDLVFVRKHKTNIFESFEEEQEEQKDKWTIKKKANLKFWNFYVQNLKNMWRSFLSKNDSHSGIFFALLIFSQILLKFLVNKTEKIKETEEQQKELKEREELNKRLQKKKTKNNKQTFYQRYLLRKDRFAGDKKKSNQCQECESKIKNDKITCYACESNFHQECINYHEVDSENWRCENCRNQIQNSRMTRQLRKKLKYYD